MKHQTLDQLNRVAEVEALATFPIMNRNQRLERWAELLEQHPERRLGALAGTEYLAPAAREKARNDESPVTVAFEDPMLRALGLQDDTYGQAKRFFELTDWQLHNIVCDCHVGATMSARWAASRIRATIRGNFRFFAWLKERMAH